MANWVTKLLAFFLIAVFSATAQADTETVRTSHVGLGSETACQRGRDSRCAVSSANGSAILGSIGDWNDSFDGEAWTLFSNDNCRSIEIGGWVSGGLTVNADGNKSGNGNAPYGYNNVSDGVVLNQLWVYAEKTVDTGRCGADWGFRVDYLFGVDGPDNQAFADETWDFGWNSARDYGSAIPQLYGEMGIDELTCKIGYFYTIVGWEYSQALQNFFYSHSYAFYYGEPNTHSGLLATYAVNDRITVHGGWTLGMDSTFSNDLHASTFLGGVDLTITEDTSLYWAVLAGNWGDGTGTVE